MSFPSSGFGGAIGLPRCAKIELAHPVAPVPVEMINPDEIWRSEQSWQWIA